ncbi:DUF5518 domain-containing protein [Halogeometricum limi]|uniref:DUF5518 domain-containing protein n=1 Tax=Halogeometricum limi TaxID=555875 RepID=A0A1I6G2L7_9EURY|nr:DUF5518 domain-containing protein [Halogeometricum limi]SFR36455.1 hypothetical protein SAMN04488124_0772 [Halogeometricum limi]
MSSDIGTGDPSVSATEDGSERAPNTLFNALIGAAVAVVLGFVPFSPLLGGGVAGYLEGGDTRSGARIGAVSGVLAAIPFTLLAGVALALFVIVPEGGAVGLLVGVVAVVLVITFYSVALSTLGGVLGAYIEREV